MACDRASLLKALEEHEIFNGDEARGRDAVARFLAVCADNGKNAYCRTTLEGHITASALVLNEAGTKCLLVHHKFLDCWLCPGGHCDGDDNVLAAACREVEEETGVTDIITQGRLFDVDVHDIPARAHEPAHKHYDVCFLLRARDDIAVIVSDESNDVRWFAFDEVPVEKDEPRMKRILDKAEREAL